MDDAERERLAGNIVGHASAGVSDDIKRRVIDYWTNVDAALGARVAAGLGHGNGVASRTDATLGGAESQR